MVAVFVALGHGALRDPYHPSIGAAVGGDENASAPERAARLKRAVTALIERGIREATRLF